MPIIEYFCPQCKKRFEELKGVSEGHHSSCPSCGTESERVVSLFSYKMGDNWHKASNIASDGEGFKSVAYSRDEYNYRFKHNLKKEDKV